jgi:hypothetical protein
MARRGSRLGPLLKKIEDVITPAIMIQAIAPFPNGQK